MPHRTVQIPKYKEGLVGRKTQNLIYDYSFKFKVPGNLVQDLVD